MTRCAAVEDDQVEPVGFEKEEALLCLKIDLADHVDQDRYLAVSIAKD